MPEITLVMRNQTEYDLTFHYNDTDYIIPAGLSKQAVVEAGHQIWADPAKREVVRLKSRKFDLEGGLHISKLNDDVVIECRRVAYQLQLHRGVDNY